MNKYLFPVLFILTLFFFSCKSQPSIAPYTPQPNIQKPDAAQPDISQPDLLQPDLSQPDTLQSDILISEKLEIPVLIIGKGIIPEEKLTFFLLYNNRQADYEYVKTLAQIYIEEAFIEGINYDVAFAQMCLETGYLKFGGLVQPEWNNFCGLGAIGPGQPGLIFSDVRTGVRAHIQHLKAYATTEPLKQELVDPRYRYVRLGSSPAIEGLAGTWASDRQYAVKINNILIRLYEL